MTHPRPLCSFFDYCPSLFCPRRVRTWPHGGLRTGAALPWTRRALPADLRYLADTAVFPCCLFVCWPMDTNVLRQHDMALKQLRPEWEKTQKTKKAASLLQLTACVFCGAPEEIRTPGLQVRSLLLYPAELRARCEKLCIAIALSCQILSRKKSFFVRKPLPAFRLPVWQKVQGSPFPRTRCHRAGSSTAGQDSEYARQKTERRSKEVTSPQRRRGDRPGSQSHRLRRHDDRNVFLMRGRAAPPASQAQAPHSKEHIPDLGNKKRAPASLEPVCFFMVGMARFERAASASRTLRSSQTEPHPVARGDITPKPPSMQAFFAKKFFRPSPPF